MKDVLFKLDPVFPKLSIMNGNEVVKVFKEITDIRTFEELDIPLATISTDIINNKKIESKNGDLINAIKASIAIPGVLSPTYVNNNLCVDGGLIDPVPLQSIVNMGSEVTIAVNLYGLQSSEKQDNKYNEPDILIEPPIDQFKGWDFHRSNELIQIGYEEALKVLNLNKNLFI
jgi:NTE family protein